MTPPGSVFQAVAAAGARHPDRPALTGAGRTWTYLQLVADAERIAGALAAQGCAPGQTLAVVARNTPLMALVWLAAARLGVIVSLVNFMLKADELGRLLQNLEPQLLFCDAAGLDVCEAAVAGAGLSTPCLVLEEALAPDGPMLRGAGYEGPHPADQDAHEISYTSGTTSAPKGAVLTHAAVLHRGVTEAELFAITEQDAAIVVAPLFHQSGIRNTVLLMWIEGGHAVIAPKFEPAAFWPLVREHRATYCCLVETMLLFLDREPPTEAEYGNSLRVVLCNGDPDVLQRLEARFSLRFVTVYGMTENGVPVAVPQSLEGEALQKLRRWKPGAFFAGWPQRGTEVRLVRDGAVVAGEGESGEIQLRGQTLFREYHRAPQATAEAFEDGWFRTGDMAAYGPDDALYFMDRIRDVIRRGGENIASKEVEGVILAHPDVANVAVAPAPDPIFQQEVWAVVVPRAGASLTAAELWRWCDERLARYKVPRYVEFRDALPMSGTGRIQKQALRDEGVAEGRTFDRRRESLDA
jgi:acyl-CoA synthetase (AMP-forming)/AMP-acid ligase II